MGLIIVTQRTDPVPGRDERRDSLDVAWASVFDTLGHDYLALPNHAAQRVPDVLTRLAPDGVVLSGGNSIHAADPHAPDASLDRDQTETAVLEWAQRQGAPTLGVCRGMQMMNVFFGGSLVPVTDHIATRHALVAMKDGLALPTDVNSYHAWGIGSDGLASCLEPIATDEAGHIEAFRHRSVPMVGIMWHPERERTPAPRDIALLKELFA